MINVLADQYLYNIQSYLPENIHLQLFDPAKGLPSNISDIHGLLIRTVIPINKQTLPKIPDQLSFMGTASAGTDHVDTDYLQNHDITFADAAGCNARSVAEYVATALLLWEQSRNHNLQALTAGIVGVGHVGTQVSRLLDNLGISTVQYDPPRENREADFSSSSLDEVLDCDILSFHIPLTQTGDYPTYLWLDSEKLANRAFDLVINSARGGVVDEQALLQAKRTGLVRDIIIDVWEHEPEVQIETAQETFIKTPHIAGYSDQAKSDASKFVADALIDHFELPAPNNQDAGSSRVVEKTISEFDSLSELLTFLHPIKKYETKLSKILKHQFEDRGTQFNKLRADFPLRNEFPNTFLPTDYFEEYPILTNLGFSKIE